jgi:crossover junction endonuclease MUS81
LKASDTFTIPAGSYTVELVLDIREKRSSSDHDYIPEELTRKGVKPLIRSLELGDALWVAVLKDTTLLSREHEEGPSEIMLDWIAERKRMDDLISSIMDKRFDEQKFRLHRSGVKNVVYIVEDFSISDQTKESWDNRVKSALASTQITDNYFLKRTRKLDDTISYLVRMTQHIRQLLADKPLTVIRSHSIEQRTYLPLLTTLRTPHYITFEAFSALSSKSGVVTVRDQFLKFLMCIRGVSGDKALAIASHWSTPRAFLDSYANCPEKDRATMVKDATAGTLGTRAIGVALSKKISEIWGT